MDRDRKLEHTAVALEGMLLELEETTELVLALAYAYEDTPVSIPEEFQTVVLQ